MTIALLGVVALFAVSYLRAIPRRERLLRAAPIVRLDRTGVD